MTGPMADPAAGDAARGSVLLARDLAKRYGGVTALQDASVALRAGEVHGLVGENGAGKSTLVKILCGVVAPDDGEVSVDGATVSFASSREASAAGIAFVAQELSLFPDLSVRENLFPNRPPRRLGLINGRAIDERARPVLAQLGLDVDMRARAGDLPLADQQLLEICRAMLQQPRVLILDEPTSAQSKEAVDRLARVLASLADRGLAILYISHFLEEVIRMASRISVMRDGRIALPGVEASWVSLTRLVEAMIGGAAPADDARNARIPTGSVDRSTRGLVLREVSVPGVLDEFSMETAPGEVVGVAGLQGAGHLAVLEAVCGRVRPSRGEVLLPGGVKPRSLRHAYASGVGLVPSDRKRLGLMLDRRVWENISSVSWLGLGRGSAWQRRRVFHTRAAALLDRLRVRGDADTVVGQLSGGNQQKIVFAKWMDTDPSVMVLDDPTRGVDIGARAEMHAVIGKLAAQGKIVVVASTDLAELVELCDRVVVLQRGRVVDELAGERLDERALSTAMNAGFVTHS
ncbi:MAG: sugar ABC transporter ATP-binding protein [Streptosporangiaceae bacterium]